MEENHDMDVETAEGALNSLPSDVEPKPEVTHLELRDELEKTLKNDLDLFGHYFAAFKKPFITGSSDPALCIEGIGPIPLPLTKDYAQRIISTAAQAPYGHGEQTIVDARVRHTWQIEPSKVEFGFDDWNIMLEGYVEDLCEQLGEPFSEACRPKCQLHKLLVYEKGSHFLPHQDSEKAHGMFATMIILLPSEYAGGEVHLTHGWRKDVINMSSDSRDSIAVLGWYTDVIHEVKPIESGYRLALSYNLIRNRSEAPLHSQPVHNKGRSRVQEILMKWKTAKFRKEPTANLMAYIFEHQYSQSNLKSGLKSLKGKDLPVARCLEDIARELGFTVLMGHLEYYILGLGRDQPGLSEGEDEEDKPDEFYNIWERKIKLTQLVDLGGESLNIKQELKIKGNGVLIPVSYLKEQEPDDSDYEEYTGNDGNNVEYWYRRTALIFFPEAAGEDLLYPLDPSNYALFMFKQCKGNPSEFLRMLAWSVPDKLVPSYYREVPNDVQPGLQVISEHALRWLDLDIWSNVVKASKFHIGVLTVESFLDALKIFGFGAVQPIFNNVIKTKQSFAARVDFIRLLPSHARPEEQTVVAEWCQDQPLRALNTLKDLKDPDGSVLLDLLREEGFGLLGRVLPQFKHIQISFDELRAFMESIWAERSKCVPENIQEAERIQSAVSECIELAITLYVENLSKEVQGQSYWTKQYLPDSTAHFQISRLIHLLDFCISSGNLMKCGRVIDEIFKVQKKPSRLAEFLLPLAQEIHSFLTRVALSPDSSPFSQFFRLLVEEYVQSLPSLPPDEQFVNIRTLGCGCGDCNLMDDFITNTSSEVKAKSFELSLSRRHHLEIRLADAENLVVFATEQKSQKNPHGLRITKVPATILTQEWHARLIKAQQFLESIGTKEELNRILGDKDREVQDVLANIARATGYNADPPIEDAPAQVIVMGNKRKRGDEEDCSNTA